MPEPSTIIICEYCDSAYQHPVLGHDEKAHCVRCGAIISRPAWLTVEQLLALSVTAGMLLTFLCLYPVMSVHTRGQLQEATLIDAATALAHGPVIFMALMAAFATVLVPAFQVGLLIWLLSYACRGKRAPGFQWAMRNLEALRPWSMLEVFLLGALVTVFKLTGRLEAEPALGLFALGFLSLLMIGVAGRDIRMLWEQVS